MFIGTQYYRPPFPEKKFWNDDFKLIRDTGLNVVQLWACWAWIEPTHGVFKFDDYDELINIADKNNLKVVISTIAEIHPFWIHRIVPDSYMINNMGGKVVSSLRAECNVGLTPGGCFDNPKVLDLMGRFLRTIAERYSNTTNLLAWDCWNENRWHVQADGYVCYCQYTLEKFRNWLKDKYGDLDGLCTAWKRRYDSWDDVLPGKLSGRPYTEMIEFQKFLTWRAGRHMRFRYEQIKPFNKNRIISAHCATPSTMSRGWGNEQTLSRGNDWDHADQLDGYGCSHFPVWGNMDLEVVGTRLESVRSAVGNKIFWVSELQGGAACHGFTALKPVLSENQQSWIWTGISRGAKGIIFWCWRDEVFGGESSGFGIIGHDGYAKQRLAAMNETCKFLDSHKKLVDDYVPDAPKIGIVFEPDTFYLDWAEHGKSDNSCLSLLGYLTTLEKLRIPYRVIETNHFKINSSIKLLIFPWPLVINDKIEQQIVDFVNSGGTVVVEGEPGAFTSIGFYNYPGSVDRGLMTKLGLKNIGRRINKLKNLTIKFSSKESFKLIPSEWFTPIKTSDGKVLAAGKEKDNIVVEKPFGKGKVFAIGMFLGKKYYEKPYPEFEKFVQKIADLSTALPDIKVVTKAKNNSIYWRTGMSGKDRMLFIVSTGKLATAVVKFGNKNLSITIKPNSWNVYKLNNKLEQLK